MVIFLFGYRRVYKMQSAWRHWLKNKITIEYSEKSDILSNKKKENKKYISDIEWLFVYTQ